ncbi:unnamed protein product [Rotaria magnacalcarata]
MDTNMDSSSFDYQSIYVSFEERRWLFKQRVIHDLDKFIKPIADFQKMIRGYQQFSMVQKSLSSSSMVAAPRLADQHRLYYQSVLNGNTDIQIDQLRLHNQQMFQLIFADTCTNVDYRIFIIIIEGFVFYSSTTVKEYKSLMKHEMNKFLSSFHSFIKTRASKIINLGLFLRNLSLPCYTIHRLHNTGILFQLLPKVHYCMSSNENYNSIMAVDEYSKHIISPEELRFIDYSMNMKNKPFAGLLNHTKLKQNPAIAVNPTVVSGRTLGLMPNSFPILHSHPITYPYDDNNVYGQKYPLFWKGNNYKNENSKALFESISIDKASAEYLFVQRAFHQTVSDTKTKIAFVERIENPHLWEKFCSHRSYMRRKNDLVNLNETWLFHGTKSDNHHQIMAHGFNRSYCNDYVLYGRGVYFSRHAGYSSLYSDHKDVSFLFLCRVLVGHHVCGSNDIRVPPMMPPPNGKLIQADSTTDGKVPFSIVCTFHDDQNYPEYIITFMNKIA